MALSGTQTAQGKRAKESQNVYEKDVDQLIQRMLEGSTPELRVQLPTLAERLKDLRERNMLKDRKSVV